MKRENPDDLAKKRELLIYGVSAFAITVVVVVFFRVTGLLDWSTAGKTIITATLGDIAICFYWWHFRD